MNRPTKPLSTYIDYSDKIIEHVKGGKVSVEDGMELLIKGKSLFKTTFTGAMLVNGVSRPREYDEYSTALKSEGTVVTMGPQYILNKLKAYQQAEGQRLFIGWETKPRKSGWTVDHYRCGDYVVCIYDKQSRPDGDYDIVYLPRSGNIITSGVVHQSQYPKTLNDFCNDCKRAGIILQWNEQNPEVQELGKVLLSRIMIL